jgi:protein-disulfide isomerase
VSKSQSLVGVLMVLTAALAACSGADELPPDCAPVIGESPTRGPDDAWVTIVEFADFECPFCGSVVPTLKRVDEERPGVVRWAFKHLPLSMHRRALPASIAAECAHEQDLFWPMYEALYSHQSALGDAALESYAQAAGVDVDEWRACLDSDRPRQVIANDRAQAADAAVQGTPTFFVNRKPLVGALPLGDFLDAVDEARKKAQKSGLEPAEYYDRLVAKSCG